MEDRLVRCRFFFLLVLFISALSFPGFAAGDYKKGNGTVISVTQEKKTINTLRKCNYALTLGDNLSADKLNIYENHDSGKILGTAGPLDKIELLEIFDQKKPAPYYWDEYFEQEIWYHIATENLNGWIKVGKCLTSEYDNNFSNPYENDRWSILETISHGKDNLTVRKYEQDLFVNEKAVVYKNPWQSDDNIITIIDGSEFNQSVTVKKVIEEPATINNVTDHWLYISYKKFEGWIFGSHTFSSLSKEKYHFPEMIIKESLNASEIVEMESFLQKD